MIDPTTSYSGATFVVEDDNRLIKLARNIQGSGEMQIQHISPWYQTPKVFYVDNKQISMQYLPHATNMIYFIRRWKEDTLINELNRLMTYITSNITGRTQFSGQALEAKIQHVITRLTSKQDILVAEQIIDQLQESYTLPSGRYHGDLTFGNILYNRLPEETKPYLIDFLPGYISSPILDFVKLKQEYKLGWSMLCDPALNELYGDRYNAVKETLKFNVESFDALFGDTRIFEAINLLRILPYSKTEAMSELLRKSINQLIY